MPTEVKEKKEFTRLPTNVTPTNYKLFLNTNLLSSTFSGKVTIDVTVNEETKEIVLNSVGLSLNEVTFKKTGATGDAYKADNVEINEENELVKLSFIDQLTIGEGQLTIDFNGKLNDKLKGFYRSKYKVQDEERFGAVTQFEPVDARRAFPCWDEPAHKATFELVLETPTKRVVLSNMKEDSIIIKDQGRKEITFEKTPIMSTYLLAFVIGEYEFVEKIDEKNVMHRVYTPLTKADQGKFALDVSEKSLNYFKDFFGIDYPLKKLDLIAISDFAAGAMENWGLVTYRERALLIDEKNSSLLTKRRVVLVVAHELAHQWFGNLVTMEWWTHLWLNEGFATFMQYNFASSAYPEYDIWTMFVEETYSQALSLDAMNSSHPIEVEVGHPDEIDEIFDAISYSKGSAVLRMLHNYVGEADFKKGLNNYLTKFSHKNTVTEDLWRCLEDSSGKPVTKVMPTWTVKMGYPVITVSADKEGNDLVITVSQKKFNADGAEPDPLLLWAVPIYVGAVKEPFLLEKENGTIKLANTGNDVAIKINPGHIGFYRVLYSKEMFTCLLKELPKLSNVDRLGFLNDEFALAKAGLSSTTQCLEIIKKLCETEENFSVWSSIDKIIGEFCRFYEFLDMSSSFNKFINKMYTGIYGKLGPIPKENEDVLQGMLRPIIISRMGLCGFEEVVERCSAIFKAHHEGTSEIPVDLRSAVYSIVLKHGGEDAYNALKQVYTNNDLQEEKVRVLQTLGRTTIPKCLEDLFNFARGPDVRAQDITSVFVGTSCSLNGLTACWKELKSHYTDFYYKNSSGFILNGIVGLSTSGFMTAANAKEIEEFFATNPREGVDMKVKQSIEKINLTVSCLERDGQKLQDWLRNLI